MLKILDEKTLKTDDEIEEQYKDCKYPYNKRIYFCKDIEDYNDNFELKAV